MQAEEIKALLESHIADSEVEVNIEGSHVNLVVVSPAFEGLNAVKKQQLVYAALNEQIASGVIHAVNMQTLTPAEK
jgi:acid stress-induced BolA-like protein IbaG/YrbA